MRQPDRISGRPAVILADRGTQEGQTVERDVWDEFLGTVGELSLALLGCHTPHYVAWLDGETGRVARSFVENEDGTEQMLISLLRTADHRSVNLRELYEESFEDAKLEEVFRVDWEGKIHRETDRECDRRC